MFQGPEKVENHCSIVTIGDVAKTFLFYRDGRHWDRKMPLG